MENVKVSYARSSFDLELKKQVLEHFAGKSRNANVWMWVRVGVFFALYLASLAYTYGRERISPLEFLVCLLIHVLAVKGLAYNVIHDGVHGSLSGRPKLDRAIYTWAMTLLGPNPFFWRHRHNIGHHHHVNIPGLDAQIEATPLLRLSPHHPWRSFHRFQHLYASGLYMLMTIQWIFFRDVRDLLEYRRVNSEKLKMTLRFFALKAFYLGIYFLMPVWLGGYSATQIIASYLIFQCILSWAVTVTFAVSHINENLNYIIPAADGSLGHSFIEHQMLTSMDYLPKNAWINFIFGGMSAHVAHHAFPAVSSVHLPGVTGILERHAQHSGKKYHSAGLVQIVKSHFQALKQLGRNPAANHEWLRKCS